MVPRKGRAARTQLNREPAALDCTHINTHTSSMRYSFDPAKQASNVKKHGFDFSGAQSVIESGMTVTFEDRRADFDEERFVTPGPLGDAIVVIVTTEAEDHIRIISMRKADRHEQRIYRENINPDK